MIGFCCWSAFYFTPDNFIGCMFTAFKHKLRFDWLNRGAPGK